VSFFMLDLGLFATVSLTIAYVLANFPEQVYPYLMVFATELSVVLHAGSLVTCHSFLNLRLCFKKFPYQEFSY
jgi:hypothetical protein